MLFEVYTHKTKRRQIQSTEQIVSKQHHIVILPSDETLCLNITFNHTNWLRGYWSSGGGILTTTK